MLEVRAPPNWLLREVTFPWLPEPVKAEIVGDADSDTVTLAVAVRTVRLCYLEGSDTRPPIACRRLSRPVRN